MTDTRVGASLARMIRVHVAYHQELPRELICGALAREPDFDVVGCTCAGADGAAEVERTKPSVVLLSQPWHEEAATWVARYRAAAAVGAKIVLLCGLGLKDSAMVSGADAAVPAGDGTMAILAAVRSVVA